MLRAMPSDEPETYDDSLRESHDGPRRREPQLVVVLECDRPLARSARFSLAGVNEVVLCRRAARVVTRVTAHGYTTMHVGLPARSMSSTHARLVRSAGTWILEDGGSRNGSFVNGHRVDRKAIGSQDSIEVGRVLLLLREDVEMANAPADLDAETTAEPPGFRTVVPRLADDFAALRRLAVARVPILLLGETGSGKEVVTRSLHALSERTGQLVPINCGALPQSLVEAHLFGHVKGAFSGAARDEPGFVRSADGGTLFLDEIGELSPASQTALLRVLQDGEVTPVGSTRSTRVDVRVVSATHRTLSGDGAGAFRPDLFARLAGFTFRLPPLRERIEDLGGILADLLAAHAPAGGRDVTLTPELGRALVRHSWPLNVRELQQALSAALALADDGVLRPRHFPRLAPPPPAARTEPMKGALDDESERLRVAVIARLEEHQGNVTAVARAMGKAPMQVHRWMKRFGIDPSAFRRG